MGGRESVLPVVPVNPACVRGGCVGSSPGFGLMQSLAYSGNLSPAGGYFREVQ